MTGTNRLGTGRGSEGYVPPPHAFSTVRAHMSGMRSGNAVKIIRLNKDYQLTSAVGVEDPIVRERADSEQHVGVHLSMGREEAEGIVVLARNLTPDLAREASAPSAGTVLQLFAEGALEVWYADHIQTFVYHTEGIMLSPFGFAVAMSANMLGFTPTVASHCNVVVSSFTLDGEPCPYPDEEFEGMNVLPPGGEEVKLFNGFATGHERSTGRHITVTSPHDKGANMLSLMNLLRIAHDQGILIPAYAALLLLKRGDPTLFHPKPSEVERAGVVAGVHREVGDFGGNYINMMMSSLVFLTGE